MWFQRLEKKLKIGNVGCSHFCVGGVEINGIVSMLIEFPLWLVFASVRKETATEHQQVKTQRSQQRGLGMRTSVAEGGSGAGDPKKRGLNK